jgi:predicted O-methyltransferase YrrM
MSTLKSIYRFVSKRWQTLHLDYRVNLTPRSRPETGEGLKEIHAILDDRKPEVEGEVKRILNYTEQLHAIRKRSDESNPLLPAWNNDFLPGLDIAALYMYIAERKPKKYMEVGSGNSTLVAAAAKNLYSTDTEIISIDPYPRADIDQVSQRIVRRPFEQVGTEWADELEAGDILFIDNSHRALPNSDATVFFLEWLPRLKQGVVVQVHDIYLPWDYPQDMCERGYSEQYVLAAMVMSNPDRYRPIFPAFWIAQQPEMQATLAPLWENKNLHSVERHGGSFWFEIGPAIA